jgi:hypothetical protein
MYNIGRGEAFGIRILINDERYFDEYFALPFEIKGSQTDYKGRSKRLGSILINREHLAFASPLPAQSYLFRTYVL